MESYTFSGCNSLKEISIPASVLRIADDAFTDAPLETVRYGGTRKQWKELDRGSNPPLEKAKIHYTWSTLFSEWDSGTPVLLIIILLLVAALIGYRYLPRRRKRQGHKKPKYLR